MPMLKDKQGTYEANEGIWIKSICEAVNECEAHEWEVRPNVSPYAGMHLYAGLLNILEKLSMGTVNCKFVPHVSV